MYQAIISEDFSQLLQRFNGDLSKVPARKSLGAYPMIQLLKKKKIKLEPIFPGIKDSDMARHYTVSFPIQPTAEEIEQMQQSPAFESFYEKPTDELPM